MPKVSVLTPLYNTDPTQLREMIESVLTQTYDDFEFILLNDSPDNQIIADIVKSYDDSRVVYLENPKNIGISESRNRLMEVAKGEYLAIFDHDDICMRDRLKIQANYLDTHESVGVCSGWHLEVERNRLGKTPESNDEIKCTLLDHCCVCHSAAMIRKSVLVENHIRYERIYSPAEDYMLWIRLIGVTMFYNIQKPLIKYRNHFGNTSHKKKIEMDDRTKLIKCIGMSLYPYLLLENERKSWIYVFDRIPVIKVKRLTYKKTYFLFGFLPLLSVRAN